MRRITAHNTYRWHKARAARIAVAEAAGEPCHWCRRPIDYVLSRQFPQHRMAATTDHMRELWMGGPLDDPTNLAPMHRVCNSIKSNQIRQLQDLTKTQLAG